MTKNKALGNLKGKTLRGPFVNFLSFFPGIRVPFHPPQIKRRK